MILKTLILTVALFLGPETLRASDDLQREVSEDQNSSVAFSYTSSAVEVILAKAREARERIARETQERALIFNEHPPSGDVDFITAIQKDYSILINTQKQIDFKEKTTRIRRGLVALAAELQESPVPFVNKSEGFSEEEWPETEQEHWRAIQEILVLSNGKYGARKESIQLYEGLIIASQEMRGRKRYIPFVFNANSNEQDYSLTPRLAQHEGMLELIKSRFEALETAEVKADDSLFLALKEEHIWGKMMSLFTLGVDRAQARGWANWTRTCLVAAFLDIKESYELAQSRRQGLEPVDKASLWQS